jgi:hypothetical protein
MVGMTARAAAHIVDPATITESMLKRAPERVGHEAKRIQEVALSGSIRSYQKCQGAQMDVARGDALVVLELDSC